MDVGDTRTLSYTIVPEEAKGNTVTWTSSNSDAVSVDTTGKSEVESYSEESVTITGTCGDFSDSITITINILAADYSIPQITSEGRYNIKGV